MEQQAVTGSKHIGDGWYKGYPTAPGAYVVYLNDGEMIITFWNDGGGVDTWGDSRRFGWTCLSDWKGRVAAWRELPTPPTPPS